MEFNFDDRAQTIMDVHIPDKRCYFVVRDAMHYTVMAGWKPTVQDVKDGIQEYYHPDPKREDEYKEIFGNDWYEVIAQVQNTTRIQSSFQ